jgi:AcrR family transcriptional regulator
MNTEQKSGQTRSRLLEAATEVFATAGIIGATTREIARVAKVNEVTLFRHFQNKEQLLAAVIQQAIAKQTASLAHPEEWLGDLRVDLQRYAWLFNNMLEENEDMIRTFIGEAKRHPEAARQILHEAARDLYETLIAYLRQGQENGSVREEVDVPASIDIFTGILLSGMLRRSAISTPRAYSRESYIEMCVDLFVRGISI